MKRCMILRRCTFFSFNDKSKFVSWDAFFLVNLSLPPLPNQFPNNKSSNLLFGYQTKIFQKWKLFKFWRHWGKNEKITTMKNPPSDDEDCVTWKFILMVYMQSWDNSSRNDTFSKKLPKSENKRRICWYYIKVFIYSRKTRLFVDDRKPHQSAWQLKSNGSAWCLAKTRTLKIKL